MKESLATGLQGIKEREARFGDSLTKIAAIVGDKAASIGGSRLQGKEGDEYLRGALKLAAARRKIVERLSGRARPFLEGQVQRAEQVLAIGREVADGYLGEEVLAKAITIFDSSMHCRAVVSSPDTGGKDPGDSSREGPLVVLGREIPSTIRGRVRKLVRVIANKLREVEDGKSTDDFVTRTSLAEQVYADYLGKIPLDVLKSRVSTLIGNTNMQLAPIFLKIHNPIPIQGRRPDAVGARYHFIPLDPVAAPPPEESSEESRAENGEKK